MKTTVYRTLVIAALVALTGLLVIQVYWFVKAYSIQEEQFDRKVNLALRGVADKMLVSEKNNTERISPVKKTASNVFMVEMKKSIRYEILDSLLKAEFGRFEIYNAYELAVFEHSRDFLLFGNFYANGILSQGKPTCLGRDEVVASMDFIVTFPDKRSDIIGALNIWIFTAFTFVLILFGFAYMLIDLSKQKKLAEMKTDFINNMTHELQTPIANIAMASEVLRAANNVMDPRKATKYADIIHQENQRLKFHVEQVLQTASLERGHVRMEKKKIDINQLIGDVIENFEIRIQSRQGKIKADLKASKPLLLGDRFHLANLFYNLLDNADKYSPESPEILITTQNQDEGILISVADKGIGIKREVQKNIFDKFYRAPTGNQHDIKGFGLGLTYVQQIVQAHEGVVRVISEEHKGSRFDLFFQNC